MDKPDFGVKDWQELVPLVVGIVIRLMEIEKKVAELATEREKKG